VLVCRLRVCDIIAWKFRGIQTQVLPSVQQGIVLLLSDALCVCDLLDMLLERLAHKNVFTTS
jgi:hypothetical protein